MEYNPIKTVSFDTDDVQGAINFQLATELTLINLQQSKELRGYLEDMRKGRPIGSFGLEFHEKLALALKQAKVTQEQLAASLEVSQATVSRYLKGLTVPSIAIVDKMEERLGLQSKALWSDRLSRVDRERREARFVTMTWGLKIRDARVAKKISQFDLAQNVGVSQGYISIIERQSHQPQYSVLVEIARVLEVEIDHLDPNYKE